MSTKENAEYLKRKRDKFFYLFKSWLEGMNGRDFYGSSSELSSVKNRNYYYESVTVTLPKGDLIEFEISNKKLTVISDLNPIAQRVAFSTYEYVLDINNESGGSFIEIPKLKVLFKTNNQNDDSWWFENERRNEQLVLANYFDAVIDHFKEEINGQE